MSKKVNGSRPIDSTAAGSQAEKFAALAREVEAEEDEQKFDEALRRMTEKPTAKVCPECGHVFRGNGWDGIDAHWKSKHEAVMPYEEAWPLLKAGTYK
ncbi:hypothetical protein [Rubellimicrobium aerolatum]|uniref:C2H2-type domain-containing protein n=1 Tax=Rubellimicrobium aerolatum TaxID=490979 RepID=A0ABW0S8Q7_9RHOB|nr:hypothetical protein [Rubellimicrobium aerolatum]MBP1804680.1 hypothetical protein [Rubellimicrobium aerolatum]